MILEWEDRRHVIEMTKRLPLKIQNYLITNYLIIFEKAHRIEQIEHAKYNAGFFAANSWLREETENMQKFDKPDFLIEYEKVVKQGPPRVCHSCDHYRYNDGQCLKFNQAPPVEFVQTKDACGDWLHRIPF